MQNPYNPETEKDFKWRFNEISRRWVPRLKENIRSAITSRVDIRTTSNGIEIRKKSGGTWTPASDIVGSKDK